MVTLENFSDDCGRKNESVMTMDNSGIKAQDSRKESSVEFNQQKNIVNGSREKG